MSFTPKFTAPAAKKAASVSIMPTIKPVSADEVFGLQDWNQAETDGKALLAAGEAKLQKFLAERESLNEAKAKKLQKFLDESDALKKAKAKCDEQRLVEAQKKIDDEARAQMNKEAAKASKASDSSGYAFNLNKLGCKELAVFIKKQNGLVTSSNGEINDDLDSDSLSLVLIAMLRKLNQTQRAVDGLMQLNMAQAEKITKLAQLLKSQDTADCSVYDSAGS